MGIDWVPARSRPGVDPAELRALVAEQARLVWLVMDGVHDSGQYEVAQQIRARLDIPDDEERIFRVNVITNNHSIPPEWRREAYTTLLPDDLARAVSRWQWWYGEITADRMRHYRRRLAAWHAARGVHETHAELTGNLERAEARTNAFTLKERFHDACARVRALPAAPPVVPPGPPPTADADDTPAPDQDAHTAAVEAHIVLVADAARAFNRSVPAGFKVYLPERLEVPGRDPRLEKFFTWVTPIVRAGEGLFLWA